MTRLKFELNDSVSVPLLLDFPAPDGPITPSHFLQNYQSIISQTIEESLPFVLFLWISHGSLADLHQTQGTCDL